MSSSLVPEKPLLIYPSLAATLGLEESVLLCVLADKVEHMPAQQRNGFNWYQLSVATLQQQLPFWNRRDLQRICTNLRDKGVLICSSASLETSDELRFAFNDRVQQKMADSEHAVNSPRPTQTAPSNRLANINTGADLRRQRTASHEPSFLNKNFIPPNWQPDDTTLAQLAQHGMTGDFAMQQVGEFIAYWRDRGEAHHSWNSKFIQHALRQWRNFETKRHQQDQETPIRNNWQPSADAMEILVEKGGIKRAFVEDAIPEFILYWRERGDSLRTWNTKFVQHVRMQWAKFTAAIEHNTDPHPIAANWQPSEDVYDVLRLANIDVQFARSLIPEFVLYWRDRGALYGSWNTKYLQHIKFRWAQRHDGADPINQRQTRDITLEEELTDRSWAD